MRIQGISKSTSNIPMHGIVYINNVNMQLEATLPPATDFRNWCTDWGIVIPPSIATLQNI